MTEFPGLPRPPASPDFTSWLLAPGRTVRYTALPDEAEQRPAAVAAATRTRGHTPRGPARPQEVLPVTLSDSRE